MKWEMVQSANGNEQKALLLAGWEPFAVTQIYMVFTVYFKREVKV